MKIKPSERLLWILLSGVLVAGLIIGPVRHVVRAETGLEQTNPQKQSQDANRDMQLIESIYMKILNEYVDEQKPDDLMHNAIDGMIKGLKDPHSAMLVPQNYKELKTETEGKYGGLGIVVGVKADKLTIISPMEDTPAERAKLMAGDSIIKINGTNAIGMSLDSAVERLRGIPGAPVTLTIQRENEKAPFDVTLVREIINVKSVKASMIGTNCAYVRISSFSQNTPEQLTKALNELQNSNYTGMLIDLRNNPGGLLDVAIKVADMFLDDGVIVSTKGRIPQNNHVSYGTSGSKIASGVPIIVLVNKGSASASEIFAGAIQDKKRGVLLGTQTYGKGSVQTVLDLGQGYGLRLTIARYYTPADRCIDKVGLTPDIIVDSENVPKDEFDSITRLDKTNIITGFSKEHKDTYTDDDFQKLQQQLKGMGIGVRDSLVKSRIKFEQTHKQAVYDLDNDVQLRQALQILRSQRILDRSENTH